MNRKKWIAIRICFGNPKIFWFTIFFSFAHPNIFWRACSPFWLAIWQLAPCYLASWDKYTNRWFVTMLKTHEFKLFSLWHNNSTPLCCVQYRTLQKVTKVKCWKLKAGVKWTYTLIKLSPVSTSVKPFSIWIPWTAGETVIRRLAHSALQLPCLNSKEKRSDNIMMVLVIHGLY